MLSIYPSFPMAGVFGLLFILNIGGVASFLVFAESTRSAKQFIVATSILTALFCAFYVASDSLQTFKNMGPTIALFLNLMIVFGMTNLWDLSQPQRWG